MNFIVYTHGDVVWFPGHLMSDEMNINLYDPSASMQNTCLWNDIMDIYYSLVVTVDDINMLVIYMVFTKEKNILFYVFMTMS